MKITHRNQNGRPHESFVDYMIPKDDCLEYGLKGAFVLSFIEYMTDVYYSVGDLIVDGKEFTHISQEKWNEHVPFLTFEEYLLEVRLLDSKGILDKIRTDDGKEWIRCNRCDDMEDMIYISS